MVGESGVKDEKEARTVAIALIVLVVMLVVGAIFAIPMLAEFNQEYLAPGLGVKSAAIIAFIATFMIVIVFAITAGDGLIGEFPFMLAGFFAFFVVLWLLIAWIF